MTRQKSLKYINKLKQIAIDFMRGNTEQKSATKKTQTRGVPTNAKDEIEDIYAYKQSRHKLKRKKRAKRTKLKK